MGTNLGRQGSKATHTRRATLLQGAAWRLTVPWRALIRGLVLCLVLAGWLAPGYGGLPVAAAGTTRYVAPTGSDSGDCSASAAPCKTIGYAISQAQNGDTISIAAGTYYEYLDIEKNLTLVGAGASTTAIDGSTSATVVTIGFANTATVVTLSGVTIQHGNTAGNGGGIVNAGRLTLASSTVLSNTTSSYGGGIDNTGTLTLTNSTVVSNTATSDTSGGGGIYSSGTLTLTDSTVSGNTTNGNGGSGYGGGGIDSTGILTLTTSTVSGNTAVGGAGGGIRTTGTATLTTSTVVSNTNPLYNGGGGGIYNTGMLMLANSTVRGNTTYYGGGGIDNDNGGTAMLADSTVSGNSVCYYCSGGGIGNSGTLTATDSTVSGNSGGGISNYSTLTLTTSIVSGNSGGSGGISNSGALTLTTSTVVSNTTTSDVGGGGIQNVGTAMLAKSTVSGNSGTSGGGIYNYRALTLTNSTISGNSASYAAGGGIRNSGTVTLTNSMVSGNSASRASAGGIDNDNSGTAMLANSTVSGNSSYGAGGGIQNEGTLTLTNSTISGNSVSSSDGGGIRNGGAERGTLTLTNSTISGNSTSYDYGGGISNYAGWVTLTNSILAGNTAPKNGPDCYSDNTFITSGGYNLLGIGDGCSALTNGVNGDQVGTSSSPLVPLLDPLGDYGGPTLTMAPQPGSPALDAMPASHCPLTTDQRGRPRPDEAADSGACDIGAVEGTGPAPSVSLSASSLDFGTESMGYFGVAQTVTLINSSVVPLFLSSTGIAITGTNPKDFLESDTCAGTTIAPGVSCSINVNFRPGAAGTRSAVLRITDNAADSPQMVSLSGTGTLPPTNTPMPPSASPTSTPVPPTSPPTTQPTATPTRTPTPSAARLQPTATPVVCTSHPAPPPLGVGIAPHRPLVAGSSGALALSRTLRYVTGGGTLPLLIRTAPRATVNASLDVVVTKVVIQGTGAHRTRTTRRVVLYHTVLHGTADAHGRFSPLLHVAYQPNRPVTATLIVRAQTSCSAATHRSSLTILPLRITVTPRRLVGGSPLTVMLHTGGKGQVSITVEVDTTRDTVMGQGTQRHHVRQVVALYRRLMTGTADAHGRFSRRVAIAYQPRKPMPASITVTVRLPQGTATGAATAMLLPPRHH